AGIRPMCGGGPRRGLGPGRRARPDLSQPTNGGAERLRLHVGPSGAVSTKLLPATREMGSEFDGRLLPLLELLQLQPRRPFAFGDVLADHADAGGVPDSRFHPAAVLAT